MIEVSDLQVDCIVGVLEREQRQTQRIVLDLRLGLDLEPAGDDGALELSVDYAAVADAVRLLAEHGRFRLIESLGLAVCRLVLAPPGSGEGRARVRQIEVAIRKPEILAGVCVPGVRMARDRAWYEADVSPVDEARGVRSETLIDLPQGGAWRVLLDDGARLRSGDRAILVLAGAVEVAGRTVGRGERLPREIGEIVARGPAVLLAVGHRPAE